MQSRNILTDTECKPKVTRLEREWGTSKLAVWEKEIKTII